MVGMAKKKNVIKKMGGGMAKKKNVIKKMGGGMAKKKNVMKKMRGGGMAIAQVEVVVEFLMVGGKRRGRRDEKLRVKRHHLHT